MNIQNLKITQIKVNGDNPRTITGDKFNKLINSILIFPKMLRLRPVVIDKMFVVIGGNMRTNALNEIAKMSADKLINRLENLPEYKERNAAERTTLCEYWRKWLKKPHRADRQCRRIVAGGARGVHHQGQRVVRLVGLRRARQ